MKEKAATLFRQRQDEICSALEDLDQKQKFLADSWEREDSSGSYGGGGESRVLSGGGIFEKAGVNFSEVHGTLPETMSERLVGKKEDLPFYATGISLVLHPESPMIPTTHANFRYLEVADKKWFGGGADLTPYYFFKEDAQHFHITLKAACDKHSTEYYPKFKKWCDEYFYLPHRKEHRGIGGIFFDYIGKDDSADLSAVYDFVVDASAAFVPAYAPIVQRTSKLSWGEKQKEFQLIRRGRYVEFNLIYDRGTLFGLKTGGRTESILMSLPAVVHWEYNYQPESGSPEAELISTLTQTTEWT